ncbi:hypothetical protein ACH5RR_017268 [Cinchona calisaya]|uniref:RRM domain-containing protein n=1 Tax=Cinchona calisaya TaxID=153742 RepID=A0ABD2ZZH5_9GENT
MAGPYNRYGAAGNWTEEYFPEAPKRLRHDSDVPSSLNWSSVNTRGDGRGETRVIVDTDRIGAAYDFYLQCSKMSPFSRGESSRSLDARLGEHHVDIGGSDPVRRIEGRSMAVGGGRPEIPVPSEASRTLFVQGLPLNCTRREVSHLFRPFMGYEEVRIVRKEAKHPGGNLSVLCFVDFVSPALAAIAKDALQGYKFDELDPDSDCLRLQFARHPGWKSLSLLAGIGLLSSLHGMFSGNLASLLSDAF